MLELTSYGAIFLLQSSFLLEISLSKRRERFRMLDFHYLPSTLIDTGTVWITGIGEISLLTTENSPSL
jgi:hypothetical protein